MPQNKRKGAQVTSDIKKKKIEGNFASAYEDGWKIGKKRFIAIRKEPMRFNRVHRSIKHRDETRSGYLELLSALIPIAVWDYLVIIVNREMISHYSSTKSNPLKATNVRELIKWYSVWIEVENTFGNDNRNLDKHLGQIDMPWKLGVRRFKMIKTGLNPSITELVEICSLFSTAAKSVISSISLVVIDEHMNKYEPKKEAKNKAEDLQEPIPVQYIPRKPHPNGLLVYLLASHVVNPLYDNDSVLPFVVDFEPHLTSGDCGPQKALKACLERWNLQEKPSIIGDAAFGSEEMVEYIRKWGATSTFSININQKPFLWSVLQSNLPPDHWKYAVVKDSGVYACTHCLISSTNSIINQQIFTNMVAGFEDEDINEESIESEQESDPEDEELSLIPKYTLETLEKLTVKALRDISKQFNIKQGKKKADLIEKILRRVSSVHDNLSGLKEFIRSSEDSIFPDPSPIHTLYGDHFNIVDIADKYWYTVNDGHRNEQWKSHLFLGLVRFQILNCWVMGNSVMPESWTTFRENLAKEMRSNNF